MRADRMRWCLQLCALALLGVGTTGCGELTIRSWVKIISAESSGSVQISAQYLFVAPTPNGQFWKDNSGFGFGVTGGQLASRGGRRISRPFSRIAASSSGSCS